jgi:hypothetical protein
MSHETLDVVGVAAACAAIALTPAAWAWWVVRGSRVSLATAGLFTAASAAVLVNYGGPLMLLLAVPVVGIPMLARRHLERRGRIVTAVVLGIVTAACLLASIVVVWLADLSINCPPSASDCL